MPLVKRKHVKFITLQFLGVGFTMITGKIIAVYFNPTEYGKYFLVTSSVAFYTAVVTSPAIQAYRHYYYRENTDSLLVFFRSIFFWLAIFLAIVLSIANGINLIGFPVALLIVGQVFVHNNSALHLANINISGKITLQAILSSIQPLIHILFLFGLLFIVRVKDYKGIWISLILTELTIMFLTYYFYVPNKQVSILSIKSIITSSKLKDLFVFIRPILVLPVFVWIVTNVDRFLLDLFYSKSEVGIYSIAYGLGSKLFIIMASGIVALSNVDVYKLSVQSHDFQNLYKRTLRRIMHYLGLGLIVVLIIYLFSNFIGKIFLSPQYADSFPLLPVLAFASLVFTSLMLVEQVLYARGDTRFILYHYIIGALSNVSLNLIFIPKYGVWGAGISIVLSAMIQLCVLIYFLGISLNKRSWND